MNKNCTPETKERHSQRAKSKNKIAHLQRVKTCSISQRPINIRETFFFLVTLWLRSE